jgi:transcriptional regulator with XRE-family HTH domain
MARTRSNEHREVSARIQFAFGTRLQNARRERSSSRTNQAALAKHLGVTRPSISNIERGQHRIFLDQVYLAARALGVPLADLLPNLEDVFEQGQSVSTSDSLNGSINIMLSVAKVALDVQASTQMGERGRTPAVTRTRVRRK